VKIVDSKGSEIFNKTLELTKFGSFSSSLPLDKNVAL